MLADLFGISPEQLLGRPTLHLPLNMIVQKAAHPTSDDAGKVVGVFQTSAGQELTFDSAMTHQLILGDAFIRPRLVFESNEFRGVGISHLLTSGFVETETWMKNGPLFNREA